MNQFGGDWTQIKIDIVEAYARAYLKIMNNYPSLKPIYFDGFAGSGEIMQCDNDEGFEVVEGAARRILNIDQPKTFDMYYFVEKCESCYTRLKQIVDSNFPNRNVHVVNGDCNQKLCDFANYLGKHENRFCRGLAYVDPFGMQVDWSSITPLKGKNVDLWILIPTGVGINRMLTKDGKIEKSWADKLQAFLGISFAEIQSKFYEESPQCSMFGEAEIQKVENAIQLAGELYSKQLSTVFKFVSNPFILRNSKNSPMYHFVLATDNHAGLNIANDVIKKRM
jgi:three-Cys-motif partner protein